VARLFRNLTSALTALDDIWSNLICYSVFAEAILFFGSKQNVIREIKAVSHVE
jgi:hypothetical protein